MLRSGVIFVVIAGLAVIISLSLFQAAPVHAENGCPAGMTPYMIPPNQPGGQPVYSCRPLNANEMGYSAPAAPQYYAPPPPPLYGAYATTKDHKVVAWVSNYESSNAAQSAAVAQCRKENGGDCEAMDWFSEQCGAWAQGSYGGLFSGYDTSYKTAAREAIDNCNDGDKGGKCRLRFMPVCTGSRYSEGFNSKLKNATLREIENLSAQNDRREYWGMLAANTDNVVMWGADYPSKSVARSEVLSTPECKGTCRELVTFRNSCAAAAWEKKTRNALSFAIDGDPVVARKKAIKLCTKDGGQNCGSFVRCSGRAYIDGYEGSDS